MSQVTATKNLYRLHETRSIRLRIHYPTDLDKIVLRTEMDWDRDILPTSIDRDGLHAEFEFNTAQPFVYLKPCLRQPSGVLWGIGPNNLVVATRDEVRDAYPNFYSSSEGTILDVITLDSKTLNRQHRLRVYLQPGYAENTCRSFPVMYIKTAATCFSRKKLSWGKTGG